MRRSIYCSGFFAKEYEKGCWKWKEQALLTLLQLGEHVMRVLERGKGVVSNQLDCM